MKTPRFLAVALLLLAAAAPAAHAQQTTGFVFTKIVDNNDPIPGGAGRLFDLPNESGLDGDTVLFRNGNTLNPDSIWTLTLGGGPVKAVDLNTPVPGGVGNFSSFIVFASQPGFPILRGGIVAFAGRDSSTGINFNAGIYAVPAGGGAVSRAVDYQTPTPGYAENFNNAFGRFSFDAGRIAFQGGRGVYAVNADGSNLLPLGDTNHPAGEANVFDIVNFSSPSISGNAVLFFGSTVFDPSNGYNALYNNPASASYVYNLTAPNNHALPGDPFVGHTRYDSFKLDGGTAAFVADDADSNPNFRGLFTTPIGGGAFAKIVSDLDALPGLGALSANSFGEFSARDGRVAFQLTDDSNNVGLYLANADGSGLAKIVATGDAGPYADTGATVGGATGNTLNLGAYALSGGRVAFHSFGGVYLATPAAQSADVQAILTHTMDGANANYTLTVINAGPASAAGVAASVKLPPGVTFLSASAGAAFDAATGSVSFPASPALGAAQSLVYTISTRVDDPAGTLTAGAFAATVTPDPNLNNNHAQEVIAPTIPANPDGKYAFTKIADTSTPLPDRADGSTFAFAGGNDPLPALDGGKVVFIANDAAGLSVLWSANVDGSGLTRLIDSTTPMPGAGGATFASVVNVRLRGGTAVFQGFASDQHDGIFSVPAAGGAVTPVVIPGSPRPENPATPFGYQDFIQNFSFGYLGDGQVGFTAQGGVYAYPVNGAGVPRVLVYPGSSLLTPGNRGANFFGGPALSGTRAVFQGTGASVLLSTFLDERRLVVLAGTSTPSPSATAPGGNFVYNVGDNFADAQVEGDTVVFRGQTGDSNPVVNGLYSITPGGAAVTLADANTPVPGGIGSFATFGGEVLALSAGQVAFVGTDATSHGGLYVVPAAGGAVTKIVSVGDSLTNGLTLSGNPSFSQPPIQANSLGEGRLVFRADFFDSANNRGGTGIFVATPGALAQAALPVVTVELLSEPTTDVTNHKAIRLRISRAGGDLSQPLTVNFLIKGNAKFGTDYRGLMASVTLDAGIASKKARIKPVNQAITGQTKTLKVNLLPNPAYTVGTTGKFKLKIFLR